MPGNESTRLRLGDGRRIIAEREPEVSSARIERTCFVTWTRQLVERVMHPHTRSFRGRCHRSDSFEKRCWSTGTTWLRYESQLRFHFRVLRKVQRAAHEHGAA